MKQVQQQVFNINEVMSDTRYVKDEYKPLRTITKVLTIWLVLFSIIEGFYFLCDWSLYNFKLYHTTWYYPIHNTLSVLLSLFLIILSITMVFNMKMTVKERDILKGWLIVPVSYSLFEIFPYITEYFDSELVSSFYRSFPITLLISTISLFYFRVLYKYKELNWLIGFNILYLIFSYGTMLWICNVYELTEFQNNFILIFNDIKDYRFVECLMILGVVLIFKQKLRENEKNNQLIENI